MKVKTFAVLLTLACLAACESGDININPSTADNSTDNSVTNSNNTTAAPVVEENPCASYTNSGGAKIQGEFSGANCVYSKNFADAGAKPIVVDLYIPALDNGGVHIFEGGLFIGKDYGTDAELAAAGIAKGGDGPTLDIEAGATIAFSGAKNFMAINRGSKINAIGSAEAPITFTAVKDAVDGEAVAGEVQLWGGIVINGFGVTNKCKYDGERGSTTLTAECHVIAEGSDGENTTHYGGNNDEDSSGKLEYVRVKHTGFEVAPGNELNGISFGAVGSNTVVSYLQVFSTYDDGIEFFGGAVNVDHYVGMYVKDDSIDIDEGYKGTISHALVIQEQYDGNRCIEADGIGSFTKKTDDFINDLVARKLNSRPTIDHLTCIVSPNGAGSESLAADDLNNQGTHDPGAGWRLREGIYPTIKNSLLIASFGDAVDSDNWCIRPDKSQDGEGDNTGSKVNDPTQAAIIAGVEASITDSVIACETPVAKVAVEDLDESLVFASIQDTTDATADLDTDLILLEGVNPIYSLDFADMVIGGVALGAREGVNYVGAVQAADDWTANWVFGLENLWFDATP